MTGSYKLISTPALKLRYQVVKPNGLPDIPLSLLANDLSLSLSAASVPVYMREVLSFINWIIKDPVAIANEWHLLGPPQEVRNLLRHYLTVEAQCKISVRRDTFGLKVAYVNQTNGTYIQVRILLTVLKHFYELVFSKGLYDHSNPLIHEDAEKIKKQVRRDYRRIVMSVEGRPPMPASSGVDPPSDIRLSENYFRYIEHEWVPKTIDDPNFPNVVYEAGKRYGWGLRELCVARTMFEAGPRISEVFNLTAGDWSVSRFTNKFDAQNKGSHGLRVKTLVISSPTAKLYRRYFDDQLSGRRSCDPEQLTIRRLITLLNKDPEQLHTIPLYLTQRGTPMTAQLFRDHYWKPALNAAGIDADPHLVRHWFVTNALHNIERTSKSEVEFLRRKEELVAYMAWRSGERTLAAYEHIRKRDRFEKALQSIHLGMKKREREFIQTTRLTQITRVEQCVGPIAMDNDLAFILGEDQHD